MIPKPKYVLGTTYTLSLVFFESVVFQYIDKDKNNLKACLIICDNEGHQRALSEAPALQGAARDYMVQPAPISGCFHPKVWIVVGEDEAVLLVGSGNLTQAGFINNAECFDAIHFKQEAPIEPAMLKSVQKFLTGLAQLWPEQDRKHVLCSEMLTRMSETVGNLPTATSDSSESPRFIHYFNGKLISQLPDDPEASELFIASPYFANSLKGLDEFTRKYPKAKLNIFPAVHGQKATDFPLKAFKAKHPKAMISRLNTEPKTKAFAHLKLYAIRNGGPNAWLCCTSSNCTQAAWVEPNIEAGLLRQIPAKRVGNYFAKDSTRLPEANISLARESNATTTIQCWASDTSTGIDIAIPTSEEKTTPWKNARITVRAGSALGCYEKPDMFQSGLTSHINWGSFPNWNRRHPGAVLLEIEANDSNNSPIRATCFLEDRIQLSADPEHRKALRGASALLDPEAMPDMADVSALFELVRNLFDGTLIKRTPHDSGIPPTKQAEEENTAVALWPPEEHVQIHNSKFGQTEAGKIKFFQRILTKLLGGSDPGEGSPTKKTTPDTGQNDEDDNNDNSSDAEKRLVKQQEDASKRAKRMWNEAQQSFNRLYDRLNAYYITADSAKNLWPAAIYNFLAILATMSSAKRLLPELRESSLAQEDCDSFLWLILRKRIQDEDFCPPKNYRITYKTTKFPSIADNLFEEFHIRIHPDLALLPLALVIDQKMRTVQDIRPSRWIDYTNQLFEPNYTPDEGARKACRRIWHTYVCDRKNATDEQFDTTFDELFAPRHKNATP